MDRPWEKYLYKPLNMASIVGYPNTMPKERNKWFLEFSRNNVVITKDHLYAIG
jgi:hypothetical protein